MINKENIAILSTVMNFDLYFQSSLLFLKDIKKYVIDGRNGMYGIDSLCYMMEKLKNKNIDWLIMADEDVLFLKSKLVFSLIDEMIITKTMFCGVRDGGVVLCRNQNPFVINTFFSIINFKELELIWNKKEMLSHQYVLEAEFKEDLSKLKYKFDVNSLYEHYYCFYFWLRRMNKKVLFLNANIPFENDDITNSVEDLNGEIILYHTWYARCYGENEKHTERIEKIIKLLDIQKHSFQPPIIFKDRTFAIRKVITKLRNKIINKFEIF